MNDYDAEVLNLIKLSLWRRGSAEVDERVFEELKSHALTVLTGDVLSQLAMPEDLRQIWQMEVYQQIAYNVNYLHRQKELPLTVPYVILKGTSAAKYYPRPELRTMGDIDIMTRRQDYITACDMLLRNGYHEIPCDDELVLSRHREFTRSGVEVEMHASFAHKNDPETAKRLDDLILEHIDPSHELPDIVNGIVLLEHINHHMESGLGLRQIVDWMMYVHCCLPDDGCDEFLHLAAELGLEKLAVVTTRMCEMFLGLSERKWCAGADPDVCEDFMEYVLANGNFGLKKEEDSRVSARFLSSTRTIQGTLQFLQGRGLENWKSARKYPFLRPLAWAYQSGRYLMKGIGRKNALKKLKTEYEDGRNRNALFDALGVSREEHGVVIFKDGDYSK